MDQAEIVYAFNYHVRQCIRASSWLAEYRHTHPTRHYIPEDDWRKVLHTVKMSLRFACRVLIEKDEIQADAGALLRLWISRNECSLISGVGELDCVDESTVVRLKPTSSTVARALKSRNVEISHVPSSDSDWLQPELTAGNLNYPPTEVMLVPCTFLLRPVGLIYLHSKRPGAFSSVDNSKFLLLSEALGGVIANNPTITEINFRSQIQVGGKNG